MSLLKCTNDVLSQLSHACGAPSKSTKAAKAASLTSSVSFFRKIPADYRVLAIDVGIKNFSYCQLHVPNVAAYDLVRHKPRVSFAAWSTDDLCAKYGIYPPDDDNDLGSLVEGRRFFHCLSYSVLEDLVFSKPVAQQPDVILIETQRTRSNNATSTLPIVLRNFTFENALYSTYYAVARATPKKLNSASVLVPMSAPRMSNFWLNRFLVKSETKSKYAKPNRTHLVLDWLNNPHRSPVVFDLDPHGLPLKDGLLYEKSVLHYLNHVLGRDVVKLDDLFDSLLYALGFVVNHKSNLLVDEFVRNDWDLDPLVKGLNVWSLKSIEGLVKNRSLTVNPAFSSLHEELERYTLAGFDANSLAKLA